MRVRFVEVLLACASAALLAGTPAAAREPFAPLFGLEPVGIQAFELDPVPMSDVAVPGDGGAGPGPGRPRPRARPAAPHPRPRRQRRRPGGDQPSPGARRPRAYAHALLDQPVSAWERGLAQPTDRAAWAEAVDFLLRQAPASAAARRRPARRRRPRTRRRPGRVRQGGPREPRRRDLRRPPAASRRPGPHLQGENIAYGPARARATSSVN